MLCFRIDAMPYRAMIHLRRDGVIEIICASGKRDPLPDAWRLGVPTRCIVMNRAKFEYQNVRVCEWQTPDMMKAARMHGAHLGTLRTLVRLYGKTKRPIQIGSQLLLRCYSNEEPPLPLTAIASHHP